MQWYLFSQQLSAYKLSWPQINLWPPSSQPALLSNFEFTQLFFTLLPSIFLDNFLGNLEYQAWFCNNNNAYHFCKLKRDFKTLFPSLHTLFFSVHTRMTSISYRVPSKENFLRYNSFQLKVYYAFTWNIILFFVTDPQPQFIFWLILQQHPVKLQGLKSYLYQAGKHMQKYGGVPKYDVFSLRWSGVVCLENTLLFFCKEACLASLFLQIICSSSCFTAYKELLFG